MPKISKTSIKKTTAKIKKVTTKAQKPTKHTKEAIVVEKKN